MNRPALAMGVSNLEYFNIMLTYYPRDAVETFDAYIFFDDTKVTEKSLELIIKGHDLSLFNNATLISIKSLNTHYIKRYSLNDNSIEMMFKLGCIFKVFIPSYLNEHYGVTQVYTSDDDVFIFKDLSYMFEKYKGFGYNKDNLFIIRNKNRMQVLNAYNEIFETDFTLNELNVNSINSGNLMFQYEDRIEEDARKFVSHPYVYHLYKNYHGITSWTIEQRFQHFHLHRIIRDGGLVEMIAGGDMRLYQNIDKKALAEDYIPKHLKRSVPSLIHYAIGSKKPIFLRQFILGIEWRTGITYQPKYELKDILYDKSWRPNMFKHIQKEMKNRDIKTKSLF